MNKKEIALQLRRNGYSYSMIQEKITVSKATLSQWLSGLEYSPNSEAIRRAKMGPLISGEKRRLKKQRERAIIHEAAARQVGTLTERDIFMFGLGLYVGEGSNH